jgi:predicted aldo/keto reductase-like oxidoreductase
LRFFAAILSSFDPARGMLALTVAPPFIDGAFTMCERHRNPSAIHESTDSDETRREFMQTSVAAAAGAVAFGATTSAAADDKKPGEGIPTRPLGKTGEKVSILCLGGWHIGAVKDKDEAVKIMHAALDEGVTFFDNCWDYHDGGSEEIMGKALAADGGKWRKKCFLMTKVCARDAKGVRAMIDESLKRLQTDVIDLMQMHEINWDNDPEWVVEQGGLQALLQAQKAGKVRFVGFTGHKHPAIHLKMLPVHKWDTVQCPINVCDHFYRSFAKELIPAAKKQNTGVIGMKSLGGGDGKIVKAGVATAEECIRFALSQDIAALVSGMDSMDVLKKNIATVRNFKPMEGEELTKLLAQV